MEIARALPATEHSAFREALLLALASPIIAELISGSTPPTAFFIPWVFGLFVLFYGCAAILIREFAARRRMGWRGILMLGAGFGILQEGLATRAFFDPAWRSLGPLANHGRWAGVNWIWSADAIVYHAAYSIALPILFVYVLYPDNQHRPWLGSRLLSAVAVLFCFAATVFLKAGSSYVAPHPYLAACVLAIALLAVGASRVRQRGNLPGTNNSPRSSWYFAFLGFVATAGLIAQIYALPQIGGSVLTIAMLLVLLLVTSALLRRWTSDGAQWSRRQQFGLAAGALSCFACLDLFQEFNRSRSDNMMGASVVGTVTAAILLVMALRLRVIHNL